jgi:hypothetical protein
MGRFRFDDLAAGSYQLTVRLAGFRTQSISVQLDPAAASEVVVTLRTEILSEVLWVVPGPADAYRQAAAIAHVRIDRTRPPGACGDAAVVTSHHDASVLRVFKGRIPVTMQLDQEAAGQCREMLKWYEGIERPYRAGAEYVVFLSERPDGFGLLAGPSLVFPVRGDRVRLNGFAGVRGSIGLDAFGELLERLSLNAPPDRRRAALRTR